MNWLKRIKELPLSIRKQFTYVFLGLIFSCALNAQQKTLLFIKPSLQSHQNLNPVSRPFGESRESFNAFTNCPQMKPALVKPIEIKDMAFFCRMECRVRNRANIWIKLRAGDDASYMRMIRSSVIER